MATNTEPKSACCKADYRWLDCADCEERGEVCQAQVCTECGADIDD